MSNIFTIRHGNDKPDGKLYPYELGFSDNDQLLYIGGNKIGEALGEAIPINSSNAETAKKLVSEEQSLGLTVGNSETPVYFENGVPKECDKVSGSVVVPERNRGASIAEAPNDPVDGELFFVIEE